MNQLAAYLDFSTVSELFSLRSPLPQQRVLDRLAQSLNSDVARGIFIPSYPGTGPLIGIVKENRFRLFLRPALFNKFAGDFQGQVVDDGSKSRITGNFREPQLTLLGYLTRFPQSLRYSSIGIVLILLLWSGSVIAWFVQGLSAEAAFPAAATTVLGLHALAFHQYVLFCCRKGRRKILMELAMIAESNDTPWTVARSGRNSENL